MSKMFFTITGCAYRYGLAVFRPDMTVTLIKEPENQYDREAIRVEAEGLGTVGYVANTPRTVRGTSMSAGRLYDKIGTRTVASVEYILSDSVICSVDPAVAVQMADQGEILEKMPAVDETLRYSDTADLDIYSQEDADYPVSANPTDYTFPEESLKKVFNHSEAGEPEQRFYENEISKFEEEVTPAEEVKEPSEAGTEVSGLTGADSDDDEKTVSPEEIASALTAALSSFTSLQQEDPDGESVYGDRSSESSPQDMGGVLSDQLSGLTAENIEAVLSGAGASGLSAADFVSVLTGTAASSQQTDPDPVENDAVPDVEDDTPEESPVFYAEAEERVGSSPGLSFNTARFPEEASDSTDTATVQPKEESSSETLAFAEAVRITPDQITQNPVEPSEEYNRSSSEQEEGPSDPDPADDPVEADSVFSTSEEELLPDEAAGEQAVNQEDSVVNADKTEEDEEEPEDDVTKPLVYDESELDDNLAQLHLDNIDATYLSDSFLENLKKKLKESSH